MKVCPSCGQPCEDAQKFCNNCGAPFAESSPDNQQAVMQQPYSGTVSPAGYGVYPPRVSTKKEFLDLPQNKQVKREINSSSIICYVCAAITLAVGIATDGFPLVLIDLAILVGMGLGIQLAHSRVCAIILCAYSVINMILALISTGRPAGYLIVIAGVFAVIYTFKAEKLWKQYQQGL